MKILCTDQQSEAWYQARLGRVTSSRVADMLAKLKNGGEAAGRRNLRVQLVLERLTQQSQESGYVSVDMQYGKDREADAFAAYEALTGEVVTRTGFIAHDSLMAGCSPDGVLGKFDGLIELKCCKSATHLEYLKTRVVPDEYQKQIWHQLWITGAAWCDFVSFDDRFPEALQLGVDRIYAKDIDLKAHELNVTFFLAEVDREYAEVLRLQRPVGVSA